MYYIVQNNGIKQCEMNVSQTRFLYHLLYTVCTD